MFELATSFNRDISAWNVGKVKDVQSMFNRAYSFNQDLSSWSTGCKQTGSMFKDATAMEEANKPSLIKMSNDLIKVAVEEWTTDPSSAIKSMGIYQRGRRVA